MSLFVLALAVAIVAPLAGIVYALRAGLDAFRDLKTLLRSLGRETDALSLKLEKLASFEPPDFDRAAAAGERLRRDQAQLSILLGALGRAREQFSSFATVYPRK